MSTPKYLKKKGDPDHIYHIYTEGLCGRGDMEPFEPKAAVVEISDSERAAKIRVAVLAVPEEQYGKAGFGRPALPKVKDISETVGFDVTVDEIATAMNSKEVE